ncbi:LuxR C-terminal-related transcriptional regulator [Actinophytocola sp.]|uniref:helix-turn-helix transcriptional regulator n=1 Tax=Actinophytocola sp. TaxID=1872138 RepID=UPI00389A3D6A
MLGTDPLAAFPAPDHGRADRAELRALVDGARAGRGAAVLLVGEPGSGKSTLLGLLASAASGFTVLSSRAVEAESDLPLSGVRRLLLPLGEDLDLADVDALCGPLVEALTRRAPVLLRVDDAHWLDARSKAVLAFLAGRVGGTGVLLAVAGRHVAAEPLAHELAVRVVDGLDLDECRALLDTHARHLVAPVVAEQLAAGTGGNPEALLGLARGLTAGQLCGAEPLPRPLPLYGRLAGLWSRQVHALPQDCRRLLLLAAAEDDLDPSVLADAAAIVDTGLAAITPAEAAGIALLSDSAIVFRHPVARSACYHSADLASRRAVHRALAEVLVRHRVRHQVHAMTGADQRVLTELAEAVVTARRHDGLEEAAVTMARLAELTTDAAVAARRYTTAAQDAWLAGWPVAALAMVARASVPTAEQPVLAGRREFLRGVVGVQQGTVLDAYERLLTAANRLRDERPDESLRALLAAGRAAVYAGDPRRLAEAARRAGDLPPTATGRMSAAEWTLAVKYLTGNAAALGGRTPDSIVLLRSVTAAAEHTDDPALLICASNGALHIGDAPTAHALADRAAAIAAARGAHTLVAQALESQLYSEGWGGRRPSTETNVRRGLLLARRTGQDNVVCHLTAYSSVFAAINGDEQTCLTRSRQALDYAREHGLGLGASMATCAVGLLDVTHGRWEQAEARLYRLLHAGPGRGHPSIALVCIPPYVLACVRSGNLTHARTTAAVFRRWAERVGQDWALALAARCRALLAETGDEALAHFEQALRHHNSTDHDFEHAHTLFLYAQHLRRLRRPRDARRYLELAVEMFGQLAADVWEERARAELRAAGQQVPPGPPDRDHELTPQQERIVEYVLDGATNREIATRMSVSPRTVEYHLRNIFTKIGVRSRTELVARRAART